MQQWFPAWRLGHHVKIPLKSPDDYRDSTSIYFYLLHENIFDSAFFFLLCLIKYCTGLCFQVSENYLNETSHFEIRFLITLPAGSWIFQDHEIMFKLHVVLPNTRGKVLLLPWEIIWETI